MRSDAMAIHLVRGRLSESTHRVDAVVSDPDGNIIRSWGDPDKAIYPRSSVKSLQAIPLVESGAADAFGLSDEQIALACASHNSEDPHIEGVQSWLAKIGLSETHLCCGGHYPYHEEAAHTLIRERRRPTAIHNNCSGKHAGILSTVVHLGENPEGYFRVDHPAQRRLKRLLEEITGAAIPEDAWGIDGCGIPTFALPLKGIARGMARLVTGAGLSPERKAAAKRVVGSILSKPYFVAGTARFCSNVISAASGKVIIKIGAEGVFAGAILPLGFGFVVKCADGAERAAEVAALRVLNDLGTLTPEEWAKLEHYRRPPVVNWAGTVVGLIEDR